MAVRRSPNLIVLFDAAVADRDNAVCPLGYVLLMGDDNDRVAIGMKLFEKCHDLVAALVSRAPVGSSASRIDGSLTKARAMATR